jgi:plastocyanin
MRLFFYLIGSLFLLACSKGDSSSSDYSISSNSGSSAVTASSTTTQSSGTSSTSSGSSTSTSSGSSTSTSSGSSTSTSSGSSTSTSSSSSTNLTELPSGTFVFNVTAQNSSDYIISVADSNSTQSGNDPILRVKEGDDLSFNVSASGHPFYLKTKEGTGTADQIDGVGNNGAEEGTVTWSVPIGSAGTYYYQCSLHGDMVGQIIVEP